MSLTFTSTDVRNTLRAADPVTTESEKLPLEIDGTLEVPEEDEDPHAFLPANHGVTGHEPDVNGPNWLTNHRRMPPRRHPTRHPDWVEIGGPLPMRIFLWDMFSGCQLLQVCFSPHHRRRMNRCTDVESCSGDTLSREPLVCMIVATACIR